MPTAVSGYFKYLVNGVQKTVNFNLSKPLKLENGKWLCKYRFKCILYICFMDYYVHQCFICLALAADEKRTWKRLYRESLNEIICCLCIRWTYVRYHYFFPQLPV
jgi:hypothetical protein